MYKNAVTHRGATLPAFSNDSRENQSLLGRRRKGAIDWDRAIALGAAVFCVFLFCVFLYQSHRISLLRMEKSKLQREVSEGQRESASLGASLRNQAQVEDGLLEELHEIKEKYRKLDHSISQSHTLREALQEELRRVQNRIKSCEFDAKKREEELEAEVAKITQERNDLSIRVDSEHSMSVDWARKLAEEKVAKEQCLAQLQAASSKEIQADPVAETKHTEEADLGRKATIHTDGGVAGVYTEQHEAVHNDVVDDNHPTNKHRLDLN